MSEELQGGAKDNMRKSVLRRLVVWSLAVVVTVTATGCWNPFAPEGGGGQPPVVVTYKERTSPDNVIHNLNTAYKDMNADEYLDCLAEEFEFHLNPDDYGDPANNLPEDWDKQEERDIHDAMFGQDTEVEDIDLVFTNTSKLWDDNALPGDPSDDLWTYREQTDLRVKVPGDLTYLANADQEFVFQIDPYETGPDDEPLWEIIDWWDLQETPYRRPVAEDGEERVSFGLLKSMYR